MRMRAGRHSPRLHLFHASEEAMGLCLAQLVLLDAMLVSAYTVIGPPAGGRCLVGNV